MKMEGFDTLCLFLAPSRMALWLSRRRFVVLRVAVAR